MIRLQKNKNEDDIKNIIIFSKDGFPIYRKHPLKNADFCNLSGFFSVISMYMDHISESNFYSIETDNILIAFRKCFKKQIIIVLITTRKINKHNLTSKLNEIADIVRSNINEQFFSQKKEDRSIYRELKQNIIRYIA